MSLHHGLTDLRNDHLTLYTLPWFQTTYQANLEILSTGQIYYQTLLQGPAGRVNLGNPYLAKQALNRSGSSLQGFPNRNTAGRADAGKSSRQKRIVSAIVASAPRNSHLFHFLLCALSLCHDNLYERYLEGYRGCSTSRNSGSMPKVSVYPLSKL